MKTRPAGTTNRSGASNSWLTEPQRAVFQPHRACFEPED